MEQKIIVFPKRLDNEFSAYSFFSYVQNEIIDAEEKEIVLDMGECEFMHPIFTSYLGALAYIGLAFGKDVRYGIFANSPLFQYLKASGLYGHFDKQDTSMDIAHAIPFRKISLEEDFIIDYIGNILDLAPIKLTEQAKEVLFKNIYEIFNNAVDHARSSMGVFACGYWMPDERYLSFSVYDTGVGIAALVKERIEYIEQSDEALQWALDRGNSTKQLVEGIPRGLGLSDLKSFIASNDGDLNIFTNDICYQDSASIKMQTISQPTIGTLIGITIVADYDHIYTVGQ